MPTVSNINSEKLCIFVSDINPSQKWAMKFFSFAHSFIFLIIKEVTTHTATKEKKNTDIRPIEEKIPAVLTPPASDIKVKNTSHSENTAARVMRSTINVSTSLSDTNVPNDCAKGTLSYRSRTIQRDTSPTRGTTRLAA